MEWREKAQIIHEQVVKRWEPWSQEDQRFLTLALAGEVGELANLVKKLWRGDGIPFAPALIQDELADIRIYLELLALSFDVDLDEACEAKMPELLRRWPEVATAIAAASVKGE